MKNGFTLQEIEDWYFSDPRPYIEGMWSPDKKEVYIFCNHIRHSLHNDRGPAYVLFGKVKYDDDIHIIAKKYYLNNEMIPEKDFLIRMIDAKGARECQKQKKQKKKHKTN